MHAKKWKTPTSGPISKRLYLGELLVANVWWDGLVNKVEPKYAVGLLLPPLERKAPHFASLEDAMKAAELMVDGWFAKWGVVQEDTGINVK